VPDGLDWYVDRVEGLVVTLLASRCGLTYSELDLG
jgi:hypothetical protein